MIDKMHKLLFYGTKGFVKSFLKQAQKIGSCQFFSVRKKNPPSLGKNIQNICHALKILKKQPIKRPEHLGKKDCILLSQKILQYHQEIQICYEELKKIKTELLQVSPFGDFDLKAIDNIKNNSGKALQFFMIRHTKISTLPHLPKELIFIKRDKDFDYFIAIEDTPFRHKSFYEVHIHETKGDLKKRLDSLEQQIKEKEGFLKESAKFLKALKCCFIDEMNQANLDLVHDDVAFYLEDELFCVDAWIPGSKIDSLHKIAEHNHVAVSFIKIEKGDVPPTYMKNKGYARTGEDLVQIYDVPSLLDRDPSVWVAWFFPLFFAIIVSDAGYGFIFLCISFFLLHKYKASASPIGARAMKLFRTISLVSIAWGVLVGSYFSISLSPDAKLNSLNIFKMLALKKIQYHAGHKDDLYKKWVQDYPSITNIFDANTIIHKATTVSNGVKKYTLLEKTYNAIFLEIALLIGLIHLSISFLRNLFRTISGIGWVISLWGGYFAFSTVISAVTVFSYIGEINVHFLGDIGFMLLYTGLVIALILGIIQDGLVGIASIFKAVEIFADILSYLRLYALGLASMVMAATFNHIALMTGNYFLGALICLLGHTINMGLAIMAGVIHGLRLNFLEWYRHCFEGGGRKFNPLRVLTNSNCEV